MLKKFRKARCAKKTWGIHLYSPEHSGVRYLKTKVTKIHVYLVASSSKLNQLKKVGYVWMTAEKRC